jgi:hypothetical protein
MSSRILRPVVAVAAIFILLSFAPRLPELLSAVENPAVMDIASGLLPYVVWGIGLSAVAITLKRRLARLPARPVRPRTATDFVQRIRQAAGEGNRVPALARRFHTSQDAIRTVLGRQAPPAAGRGSSFRPRQQAPQGRPVALAPRTSRRSYTALA